jgi:hypothetical protein
MLPWILCLEKYSCWRSKFQKHGNRLWYWQEKEPDTKIS